MSDPGFRLIRGGLTGPRGKLRFHPFETPLQNDAGRVGVPVVQDAARGAGPLAYRESGRPAGAIRNRNRSGWSSARRLPRTTRRRVIALGGSSRSGNL